MKYLEPIKERIYDIELCGKWIKENLTIQEIKDGINSLDWLVKNKLPELEKEAYISTVLSILIDDIKDIDSIANKEKNKEIMKLVTKEDKEELKLLAIKVIDQIILDGEEFIVEAKVNNYSPEIIKQAKEDQEEIKLTVEKVLNNINF